jgi:hypothetical protein
VVAPLAPAAAVQGTRCFVPGLPGVPGTPVHSGVGRGQGHSRDSSLIVPQREQKRIEGARLSLREWPGTPHLQHKDSG